jgi:hypothetical protein
MLKPRHKTIILVFFIYEINQVKSGVFLSFWLVLKWGNDREYKRESMVLERQYKEIPAVQQPPLPGRLLRNQASGSVDALIKTEALQEKAFSSSIRSRQEAADALITRGS